MSELTITELFTPLTTAEIRAQMVTNLVDFGIPADKWRAGGVASTMLTVMAMTLSATCAILVTIIQGFFLPSATGTGLVLLARYVYGVTVPSATFATGYITLTNTGGGTYNRPVGQHTVQNPVTKVTYTNADAISIGPGDTLENVSYVATVVGSAGNAVPGSITSQTTALLGVSVTNPAAFIGVDAPTDAAIRNLCTNKLGILSVRGVRTAYAYAIQTATNPVTMGPVNINRWAITESSHFGIVNLYVAAPSGTPDPDDVTGIETNVEAVARPNAVTANTIGATGVLYDPTITIWTTTPAGVTSDQIKDAADAYVLAFMKEYPIGGITANDDANPTIPFTGLFGEGVSGAIAAGVASMGSKLLSVKGATDLALAVDEVPTDGVTIIINLVAPASGVI